MRKIISLLAALLLLSTLAVTASAAAGITMTDAVGKSGETVYITVSLAQAVNADQISVEYSYDAKILLPRQDLCSWKVQGALQDFNKVRPYGAWAAASSKQVSGEVCVLAFQVLPGVSFDGTKVACTLTVMNGGKVVGTHNAESAVRTTCSHSYGAWTSRDELVHIRSCSICKDEQSGVHTWDAGKQIPDPKNSSNSLLVYTCTVCSGTKQFVMEGVHTPATEPEQTQPSTEPTRPSNIQQDATVESTAPPATQPADPSIPPTDPFTGLPVTEPDHFHTEPSINDHDYNDSDHVHTTTAPQHIHVEDDGHDHDHTTEPADNTATPFVIVAAAAVLIGALVFFVKKKW